MPATICLTKNLLTWAFLGFLLVPGALAQSIKRRLWLWNPLWSAAAK